MTLSPRAAALAICALLFTSTVVFAGQMVNANRDGVMLRTAPGPRATAKWTIDRGYPLEVLLRKWGWLQVRDFENDRAWVRASHTVVSPHVVSEVHSLNVRRSASPRAGVLTRVGYGDIMRELDRRAEWIRVRTEDGHVGWVARKLVWGWQR